VIDPFKKAKDADRSAAIRAVEAAKAGGQISQPDADLRVERLRQAQTMGEIESVTRDLRVQSMPAAGAPRPASTRMPTSSRVAVGVVVAVVLFVVLGGIGLASLLFISRVGGESQVASGGAEQVAVENLTTASGYDAFVSEVQAKTGSTEVFDATIYPRYAVLDVPVDGSGQRSYGWYYDGRWDKWTGRGTASEERFDLADLDGDVVAATLKKARRLVGDVETAYVLVNAGGREEGVCLSAYATGKDGETGYVDATCDGKLVFSYPG